MRNLGKIRPLRWVAIFVVLAIVTVGILNIVLGWWSPAVALMLGVSGIALSTVAFRTMWKQTDHPALHPERSSGTKVQDE